MAHKKDIKRWLKENGYTWGDMDKIWEECCKLSWKCKVIASSGRSWDDLTMFQIQQLPGIKSKALQQLKEKKEKIKVKEKESCSANEFEGLILEKIDRGEHLSEEELREICEYTIRRDYGENRRWQRSVYDILKINGRYFSITWEEGLTEYQENVYISQPHEVFRRATIIVEKRDEFFSEKEIKGIDGLKSFNNTTENKFNELIGGSNYKYKESDNGFELIEI